MMNGDRTCPSNKPYHDTGSGFNGSCSPGWRRHWVRWASATSGWSGWWNWCGWRSGCPTAGAGGAGRRGWRGRPLKDRAALARAFLAKAVLDVPTTRALVERLRTEGLLRRLCGWEAAGGVPSEATFSRAFAEFAASDLPGRLHEALLDRTLRATWRATCRGTRPPSRDENRRRPSPPPRPGRSADGVGRARTSYGRRSRAAWSGRRR